MKQKVEKLVYMIKLLKDEFPKQEWKKLQNDATCKNAIAQDLYSIYRIIDCNTFIDPLLLIKCLQYNNKESRVVGKIASICNGDDKIHTSELAKILTKQDIDELLVALINTGFKEYVKYLINLDVK